MAERSLRRRSGAHGENVQGDTQELDTVPDPSRRSNRASSPSVVSGKTHRMPAVVEEGDALSFQSRGPTSGRVSTLKNASLPPLPFFDPVNLDHHERRDDYSHPFNDVPLTPEQRSPDLERDGNHFSSFLPTPDFSRQGSIRSRFPVPKLSPLFQQRSSKRPEPTTTTLRTRTSNWKSDGETLTHNRPPLIPASSSNWTQKWPKPRLSPRSLGGLVGAIEESEGFGFDKPDRWTTHKWVLLMSTLIAFGYSSVGLAYAMLTWFRGERFRYFPTVRIFDFQQAGNMLRSCSPRTLISWFTSPSLHRSKFSRVWLGSAVLS